MRDKKLFIIFLLIAAIFLFISQLPVQAGQTRANWDTWLMVNKYAPGTNWNGQVLLIFDTVNRVPETTCPSLQQAPTMEIFLYLKHGSEKATFHGIVGPLCLSIDVDDGLGEQGQFLQDFISDVVVESLGGEGATCPDDGCLTSQNNAVIAPLPIDAPGWFFADIAVAVQ